MTESLTDKLIERARDKVLRGWIKGAQNDGDNVCLTYALDLSWDEMQQAGEVDGWGEERNIAYERVWKAVCTHYPDRVAENMKSLQMFNDNPGIGQIDVLDALQKALDKDYEGAPNRGDMPAVHPGDPGGGALT